MESARQTLFCYDIWLEFIYPAGGLAGRVDDHVASGRLVNAGDAVEERGLACPVGAYQCHDLPFIHLDTDRIDGPQTPEVHGEPPDVEHRHCGCHLLISPLLFSGRF